MTKKFEKSDYKFDVKIAVIGGGNIGTQFACVCANRGYSVNVLSSKSEAYDGVLELVDEYGNVITGNLAVATDDIKTAVEECQIIFVSYPAFALKKFADQLLPYIKDGVSICVLPGTGGAEFAFNECIRSGATLYGLQRVPAVSRLEKYGKRVRCEGLRDKLHLAAVPRYKAQEMSGLMSSLFGIPCEVLHNYLSVTLTPSNPILHTVRLYTLFADYTDGMKYDRNPLFYGDWTRESSELLIACDEELQQICIKMDRLDLSGVRSLKLHYESDTPEKMTKKISSIKSLHNLVSPMVHIEEGWIPDFKSRYFTADFPYGLGIIESFADILHCDVPNIRRIMEWYRNVTRDKAVFDLKSYGICTLDDIYELYGV